MGRDPAAKVLAALNPVARRYARRLVREVPAFGKQLAALEGGHFEAALPAPAGSDAGALVCRSFGDGDVWVRFAPPQACYPVEDEAEMVAIVKALLDGSVELAVIAGKDAKDAKDGKGGHRAKDGANGDDGADGWAGTTLIQPGTRPPLEPGQRARIYSWSAPAKTVRRARASRGGRSGATAGVAAAGHAQVLGRRAAERGARRSRS